MITLFYDTLSFLKNGVRPGLIPVLVNYFQNRRMSVKWHGCRSVPRNINGGGPQGATLGILEYIVGITSYNLKMHVSSDIPVHNQYIPADNLKSQEWHQRMI